MSIIEKLGIKPIEILSEGWKNVVVTIKALKEIEQQRNEMLKELIKSIGIDMGERGCNQPYECDYLKGSNCINPCYTYERIKIIEKIAEMPWLEIKQLIGE